MYIYIVIKKKRKYQTLLMSYIGKHVIIYVNIMIIFLLGRSVPNQYYLRKINVLVNYRKKYSNDYHIIHSGNV